MARKAKNSKAKSATTRAVKKAKRAPAKNKNAKKPVANP
jgi:hypothetical protein